MSMQYKNLVFLAKFTEQTVKRLKHDDIRSAWKMVAAAEKAFIPDRISPKAREQAMRHFDANFNRLASFGAFTRDTNPLDHSARDLIEAQK